MGTYPTTFTSMRPYGAKRRRIRMHGEKMADFCTKFERRIEATFCGDFIILVRDYEIDIDIVSNHSTSQNFESWMSDRATLDIILETI